jgi:GT2 family glycosyltransferase
VLPQTTNLGFAAAVNLAANASSAECIALMNNDMRVDPGWLSALVGGYAPADGYPCVAGLILDWEGARIDFAEGLVNYHGAAAQARFHEPASVVDVEDGKELLFACGGSMLVDRELFLDVGGFDETFFAFFEDVDFGWRLRLAGHGVRLTAGAVSFHRHHATGAAFPTYQLALTFERNWLTMLIKNLEDQHLWKLLSAALLLLNQRVVLESRSKRRLFEPGRPPVDAAERVPRIALARIHAVADVVGSLDSILERRDAVQALRRVSDTDVFKFFDRPFAPVREDTPYLEAMVRVTHALGLADLFPKQRATKMLVLSFGAADAARLRELAAAAAGAFSVVYASPDAAPAIEGVETVRLNSPDTARQIASEVDFVLGSAAHTELAAVAEDLHAGLLVHVRASDTGSGELFAAADVVLCSDEAGREHASTLVRGAASHGGPSVELLAPGDELAFFRSLSEEPMRWRRAGDRRAHASEDTLALLASWRRDYGVYRSSRWHLARATWRLLPDPLRVAAQPYLGAVRARLRRG